jgi:cysteine desulfurase/selenocysteine lyase
MIRSVTFEKTIYSDPPHKFEAGTPHISGGIGLGAALEYLTSLDREAVMRHESDLLQYATAMLLELPGLRIIGTARKKAGSISFVIDGVHPHDIGTILDKQGIAIRTGHHCAQPVMLHFGVPATARGSFGLYNTREDIDALVGGLHKVLEVFG